MYELLRKNRNDNINVAKDAKRSMLLDINLRMEQTSKEQFKEVQMYIDKIKQRVCLTAIYVLVDRQLLRTAMQE